MTRIIYNTIEKMNRLCQRIVLIDIYWIVLGKSGKLATVAGMLAKKEKERKKLIAAHGAQKGEVNTTHGEIPILIPAK